MVGIENFEINNHKVKFVFSFLQVLKKKHGTEETWNRQHFRLWSNHIDGGLTPVAQLLDKFPNKMFKVQMHESYDLWALTQPVNSLGRITVCPLNK